MFLLWLPSNRNWRLTKPMERSHRIRGEITWKDSSYGRSLQFIVFLYKDHCQNFLTDSRKYQG